MSPYEDIFFYLDLTKDILKKKEVNKAIKYYISERNKTNIKGHYGLLIFQDAGNPIFITDKKDSEIIQNAIEENWKTRPKKQSFFENGLFYIFSYIAETVRKKSRHNRIIIITDTPSDLSEDYTEALFGLVSKIKVIPTFIDIIRVSEKEERFFRDDVKLNILASDTNGAMFYLSEKKDFITIIKNLIKSKQQVKALEEQPDKIKIKMEDYEFYSRLAKRLIPSNTNEVGLKCHLCQEEICPCCADINDTLQICESCNSAFHNCCVTNYTIQNNIGIPHIFRCPKCDILLKIDQDEIVEPYESVTESVEDYLEKEEIATNLVENPTFEEPEQFYNEESYIETKGTPDIAIGESYEDNLQKVRIGGFFGKTYTIKKEGDKLVYQKVTTSNESEMNNNAYERKNDLISEPKPNKVEIPQLSSQSGNDFSANRSVEKPSVINCPSCGTQIDEKNNDKQSCPYCGHTLEI
ncbi:MAG: hypothetical protein HWN79_05350 [Candidatus Lokiarchaeota archaeon]|nr:hypothetical protein [Candidatus Lokiarchaeota archaeon]